MAEKNPQLFIKPLSTSRLEAFSDGVFAIAITLLVLEIKLPHAVGGEHISLANQLFSQWASYLAYFVSFLMIGIYWVNHHYVFRFYRGTNHVFNLLNIFFLMCISFLPFPTAVISEYIEVAGEEHIAVMFYAFGLLLPAFSFCLMWLYASGDYRLIDRRLDETFVRHIRRQYSASVLIYSFTVLISWWSWKIGLAACMGLTLLYLLPSKEPVWHEEK
ncbi:MAG: TMEM175 family protein [Acidobacteriota bacterium]